MQSWRDFKTGPNRAQNLAANQVQNDIARIFGFSQLEISSFPGDSTLSLLIDGHALKLPEVGSGLAQFILVLANVATRRPSLILIDEPELNLHPTLQVDFLSTLGTYSSIGALFGTHNVGLARAAADRIYSLRLVDGHSEVRMFDEGASLSEVLGELSFSGYRALGYDIIVLIEGRTDVKTIQQFLRHYGLDHQAVVVSLGGEEMIVAAAEDELRELTRLSDQVYCLIDSERHSTGAPLSEKRRGFIDACQRVGIHCRATDRRALENYFTQDAITAAFGRGVSALGPFDDPKALPWKKRNNWRVANRMRKSDLSGTDLGAFFDQLSVDAPAPTG